MSVTLDMLHDEIKARLEADEYFADITVLKYNQKDIVAEIERGLAGMSLKAGKSGAFVYLAGWYADAGSKDAPGPIFDAVGFNATAIETPLFNTAATGTQKPGIEIALRICHVLHHYRPEGLAETIVVDRAAIRQVAAPDDSSLAFQVPILLPPNFTAPDRVAVPVISPDSGVAPQTVALSCATAAASVYYTLDDSHPWSGNPNAVLYTAPFTVAAACAVRALAFKSGLIASDSALGIYT